MNENRERREHTRYSAHHLRVLIKPYGAGPDDWGKGEISSVDFNRYGIGVETTHHFSVGDIVMMIIRTDDASISEIPGIICNRSYSNDGFRFGIRFEHDKSEQGNALSEQLMLIEKQSATLH